MNHAKIISISQGINLDDNISCKYPLPPPPHTVALVALTSHCIIFKAFHVVQCMYQCTTTASTGTRVRYMIDICHVYEGNWLFKLT